MRRVVITGLGAVTPLGVGIQRTWSRLINSHIGLVSLKDHGPNYATIPSQVAGLVPRGNKKDGGWDANEWIVAGDQRRMAEFTQYAIAAAEEALDDAGWRPTTDEDKEATGVCLGSGIGNFEDVYNTSIAFEQSGYKKVSPLFVPLLLINMAASHIAMKYHLMGPNHAPTTACTTGAHALGDAFRLVSHPSASVDVMLAGASESCIHPLAIAGFARARSLSTSFNHLPHASSRPFDVNRDGFVMAEGAGVVVLEELQHAKARSAKIYSEIVGYGSSSDASHMTAPLPDGRGAALAMRKALREAGCTPLAVDYVNAHATSTPLGDLAENRAIKSVLLGHGLDSNDSAAQINMSSTKGAIGHLLGAAGAVESIFTILAIKHGVLPPTMNLDALGEPAEEWTCNYVANVAQEREVKVALTNSFGFGGTNASLCFKRYEL